MDDTKSRCCIISHSLRVWCQDATSRSTRTVSVELASKMHAIICDHITYNSQKRFFGRSVSQKQI
jgi:hypothetical protein